MGKEIRIKPEPGANLIGTSHSSWAIGNHHQERIYIFASQKDFSPYLVFDPDTQSWYAIGSFQDEQAFLKKELNPLGGSMGDTFSVAGFTFKADEVLTFYGKISSITAQGLILNGPGAYQVPPGKKLQILGARFTGNNFWQFGYCDNDPGLDGVDPGTLVNLTYQANGYAFLTANTDGSVTVGFEIPAGKYPIEISGDGGAAFGTYFCRLLDA